MKKKIGASVLAFGLLLTLASGAFAQSDTNKTRICGQYPPPCISPY